jgi:hypothetical protein
MNSNLYNILLIGFVLVSCDKQDNMSEKIVIDEAYFKVAEISEPYREALYDKKSDLIYIISKNENGDMFSFSYSDFNIVAEGSKGDFFTQDFPVAFGENNGNKELLVGGYKSVHIYDAKTFKLKEKFRVFEDNDQQNISSLDFRSPNLIFIGACNTNSAIGDRGTLIFDRTDGQQIDRARSGEQCQRIKTFVKDPATGQIGLFAIGFQTSNPGLITDVYNSNGEVLSSSMQWASHSTSPDILATNEQVDYFITGQLGDIYNKDDVSFIGTLDGELYYDFFLNDDGSRIYAILNPSSINVFEYPTLELLGTISPPEEAVKVNDIPATGIVDDGKMILVYMSHLDVHMSILDLPDF